MHFSTSHLRILIPSSVAMTLLLPLLMLSPQHLAVAQDPYARDGSVDSSGDGAFGIGNGELAEEPRRLREGTLIPPTAGRIVLIGRRWAFVPNSVDAAREAAATRSNGDPLSAQPVSFRSTAQPTRLGLAPTRSGGGTTRLGGSTTRSRIASGGGFNGDSFNGNRSLSDDARSLAITALDPPDTSVAKTQMLISENLMLQRVVEAIRLDAADDRWTVSGEVTEFFDHNRLIIRTAQRANTN